jgi:hypothetical protein
MPFGPNVDFIKSPIAIAPTNADLKFNGYLELIYRLVNNKKKRLTRRAFSAFSSSAPALNNENGCKFLKKMFFSFNFYFNFLILI